MKEVIIVGAGGFGREVLQWSKDINLIEPTWQIKGFIDDDLHALDGLACDYSVIGTIEGYQPRENEVLVLAIAKPALKEASVEKLRARGASFVRLIHPRAIVCDTSVIGEGVVIYPNSIIGPNTVIGDYATLLGSGVGHDAKIAAYTTISSYCDITGGVKLGKRVFLASRVTLVPNTIVGDDVYIGAGSVVIRNVRAGSRIFGYPAKKMEF